MQDKFTIAGLDRLVDDLARHAQATVTPGEGAESRASLDAMRCGLGEADFLENSIGIVDHVAYLFRRQRPVVAAPFARVDRLQRLGQWCGPKGDPGLASTGSTCHELLLVNYCHRAGSG
jgi:hypothetical protein